MRRKKTKILCAAFAMLLLAVVCVYCFHGRKAQKAQEDRSVSCADVTFSYSTIGCFYRDDQHRMLYLDANSGMETVACAKAGCEHQSHEENADTECATDVYGFDSPVASTIIQQGQYVYLLYNNKDEISDYVLYRQNLDGSERKKRCVQATLWENNVRQVVQNVTLALCLLMEMIFISYAAIRMQNIK